MLCEAGQATLLDVDHGTYPFVTSSNATAGGACTGSGIPPTRIDRVVAVLKAFTSRVGEGPFPTELHDKSGDYLREVGHEYGTTTGRPRRIGWLDLVIGRYAQRINGVTDFALTKLDNYDGLDEITVCVAYEVNGVRHDEMPINQTDFHHAKPIYETLPGWKSDISGCRTLRGPAQGRAAVRRVRRGADRRPDLHRRRRPGPRRGHRAPLGAERGLTRVRRRDPEPRRGRPRGSACGTLRGAQGSEAACAPRAPRAALRRGAHRGRRPGGDGDRRLGRRDRRGHRPVRRRSPRRRPDWPDADSKTRLIVATATDGQLRAVLRRIVRRYAPPPSQRPADLAADRTVPDLPPIGDPAAGPGSSDTDLAAQLGLPAHPAAVAAAVLAGTVRRLDLLRNDGGSVTVDGALVGGADDDGRAVPWRGRVEVDDAVLSDGTDPIMACAIGNGGGYAEFDGCRCSPTVTRPTGGSRWRSRSRWSSSSGSAAQGPRRGAPGPRPRRVGAAPRR